MTPRIESEEKLWQENLREGDRYEVKRYGSF